MLAQRRARSSRQGSGGLMRKIGDLVARLGRVVEHPGRGQDRVAREVAGGEDDVLGRVADVAEEAVPPVVERVAEPRPARDRLEPSRDGIEAEVPAQDGDRPRRGPIRRADLAAVARRRAVDRVVEPPGEVVHHRLDVELAEPREDLPAHVGLVVAVGVLEVPDVGRRRDEDAPLPGRHARSATRACRRRGATRRTGRRRRDRSAPGPCRWAGRRCSRRRPCRSSCRRRDSRSSRPRRAGHPRHRRRPPGRRPSARRRAGPCRSRRGLEGLRGRRPAPSAG